MKIGIVGAGQVGAASAYACILHGIGSEIVLVDRDPALARGQAADLAHAAPVAHGASVRAGGMDALAGAGIVMIAAGVPQKDASETRLALLRRNAEVFAEVIPAILREAPDAVLLIASNPVDVMTDLATRIAAASGVPASRVIGSGTILDTARFRALLANHLGVYSQSIHAHVLGEHGDSEVLAWSTADVGGLAVAEAATQLGRPLDAAARAEIDEGVRRAAYRIIADKGATWFGIGAGMARIARAIADDQRAVLTCCIRRDAVAGIGPVTVSLPHLIGQGGVIDTLTPTLAPEETTALARSAGIVAEAAAAIAV
ncbi:MAG: L-lactate dehydrogenase [Pseudomonadota bacterium]